MKRVLIFSLAYFPHVGGAEIAVKEITDRIADAEFHMLTLNFGGEAREEKVGNVLVHRVGNGSSYLSKVLFIPRAALAARALHRTHRFDLLWAMMSYMLFPIVLARLPVPYVVTLQEGDPFEHVFSRLHIALVRPLLRKGFRDASAVTAISTFLATWAKRAGFPSTPEVIPNGVDVARFARAHPRDLDPRHDVRLVTTSRLVHKNAVDDVIRALARLPAHVRFIIYGIGPDEAELKALTKRLGVGSRVEFKGQLVHAGLPDALAECDIFIRPSRSEGMGNSFIEAMAAGLPVIGTQEGGIADFLADSVRNPDKPPTGWAVDRDSPEQIAAAVEHILANPDETKRTTAYARTFVSERYDWSLIAAEMREVFNKVTNAKP